MNNRELLCTLENGGSVLGFALEESRYIKELSCTMWTLLHTVGGARVVFFDNGSEERCFALSFPAYPEDDTGVFHIIEHCIVEGGTKYPVRDWQDIGPQHSYFGAFTSLTNTMYPLAARNEKSFQDFVKIYTDCVFEPAFKVSRFPLMQEGWHYEYDEAADKLRATGIVLSEVKACHDSAEYLQLINRYKAAFPNSPYARDIGGAPENVPDLTYEHFAETHDRFFRPENCLACVWGGAELYGVLETLAPYFEACPATGNKPTADIRPALWNGEPLRLEYPVVGSTANRAILGFNWVFGPERVGVIAAEVAIRLLDGRLRQALSKRGFGSRLSLVCEKEPKYPMITAVVSGVNESDLDGVREAITDGVKLLIEEGPTEDEWRSALTKTEFAIREGFGLVPEGIQAALNATEAYVNGYPMHKSFLYADCLTRIRESGWPEMRSFIKRVFPDNDRHTEFVMVPSANLAQRREKAEQLRLHAARVRMDADELKDVAAKAKALAEYHAAPDDPAAIANLPRTQICDLPRKMPCKTMEECETRSGKVLWLDNGESIVRMTLHFPVKRFDEDFLHRLGLLSLVLGKVGCADLSAEELGVRIGIYFGELRSAPAVYSPEDGDRLFFEVTVSTLPDLWKEAQRLLKTILFESRYDDAAAIRTALQNYVSRAETAFPEPEERVKAYFSHGSAAMQHCAGQGFKEYVSGLLADLDANMPLVSRQLGETARCVLDPGGAAVGLSCSRKLFDEVKQKLAFDSHPEPGPVCATPLIPPRELFRAAGNMQFCAAGARIEHISGALLAAVEAAQRILSKRLRDIGGASRVSAGLPPERHLIMQTARDPNLSSTIEAFTDVRSWAGEIDAAELGSAVIAASARFGERSGQGAYRRNRDYSFAARDYWNGITFDEKQRLWTELLEATPKQILEAVSVIEKAASERFYCAWASEKKIGTDGDLFDRRM